MNRKNKKKFIAELVHVNMRMMKYLLAQISCELFGTQLLNFLTDKGVGMCKKYKFRIQSIQLSPTTVGFRCIKKDCSAEAKYMQCIHAQVM
jgi:hypothetical protein